MQKFLCFFTSLFLLSTTAQADQILWQQTTIPMPAAGSKGLETLLVWPNTNGKHPLALISHGSPRDAAQRKEMTAMTFLPIAMEFARRGFATAVVLRRGYGNSGGNWAETYGRCSATNYDQAAQAASTDLHAAINYLATLPQFDTQRMIAVGVSAGGFATVALTANAPPKGLVAAISFAGGRGSDARDHVCQQDALINTFAALGKTSRVPMLWIYAQNDHFFSPELATDFFHAFNKQGGNAQLLIAPAFGNDGHLLFSNKGIPQWTPLVDHFLKKQNLVLLDELLPLPAIKKIAPPQQLAEKNKKQFLLYLSSPPHKAFAVSKEGAFGWRSGKRTIDDAENAALATCREYAKSDCKLYAIENDHAAS